MCPLGMKIVLMKNIYDRIVSIRSNTNVFLQRKPGRTKRPGFFMCPYPLKGYIKLLGQVLLKGFNSPSGVGVNKGRYMMKFLLAMIIIRFLFSLLDKSPDEYEEEQTNDNVRTIHPAEYLTR